MPIYEYQCQACGHQLDALQKFSDPPLVSCPACSTEALRRLISAPQFRLKGSGWYETDFKKNNRRNLAGKDDKPAESKSADSGKDDKVPGKEKSGPKTTDSSADSAGGKGKGQAGDKKQ